MPPAIASVWLLSPSARLRLRLRLQSPSPSLQHYSSTTSPLTTQRRLSCHVSIKDDPSLSSSSSSSSENIGRKIRVKVPLKVYHVARSPELDLNGMIGLVKHYVGNWKGKRITPNLPFKVEFLLPVEGQDKPVRFFAHLREGEFDFLTSDQ